MQPILNSIPGLQGLGGAGGAPSLPSAVAGAGEPAPFSDLLTDAVGQVNQL